MNWSYFLSQLYRPAPVEIPERYVADESDCEDLTPEQQLQREERSDRYKKIVAAQRYADGVPYDLISLRIFIFFMMVLYKKCKRFGITSPVDHRLHSTR